MMMLPVVSMDGGHRPFPPRVSTFTRPFWDALAEGRMLTTRCRACGELGFPPRNICRGCWSRALEWVPLAAGGTLYSWTRVHVAPEAFRHAGAYAIGLVDLDDGVRLMCRLLGEPTADDLGRRVEMVVLAYDDGPLFGARRVGSSMPISTRPHDP
jgi:uncharacterized OB-fold protein